MQGVGTELRGRLTEGVAQSSTPFASMKPSQILTVLGADMFAEFDAVKVPGKVLWFNFELARSLGFSVPRSDTMTPELHDRLIDAFSYRALRKGEAAEFRPTVRLYADKYGGDGVWPARGSARAGFLPFGDLFIKGVGYTPLFKHFDRHDFAHSHGGLNMWQAMAEAIYGEVNLNLFGESSTRILAIIDQDDYTVYPNGRKIPRAIAVRAGNQLRPGHVMAMRVRGIVEIFINTVRATGQLVTRWDAAAGKRVPDLKATLLRILDDHARTAATQARWRISHCAITASNMQTDGGMLDLTTERANPRSGPLGPAHYGDRDSVPIPDFSDRAQQLKLLYQTLLKRIPTAGRPALNADPLDVFGEMDSGYVRHLQLLLLRAAGLKTKLAERVRAEHAGLVADFAEVLIKMSDLKNPAGIQASRLLNDGVSVADVFNLLMTYPRIYFAAPGVDHTAAVRLGLKPVYKGNRFHVARRRARLDALACQFAKLYGELMETCLTYAEEFYTNAEEMRSSIVSRAEFENRPLDMLYRPDCLKTFFEAARVYKATGNAGPFRAVIDERVAASMRNVEALLRQGHRRFLNDGGLEIQIKIIGGLRYAVRAPVGESRGCSLRVGIPAERFAECYHTALPRLPCLSAAQVRGLRLRCTTDGWATSSTVAACVEYDEQGQTLISFGDIEAHARYGELRGYISGDVRAKPRGKANGDCAGYVFAMPDRQELSELKREMVSQRTV